MFKAPNFKDYILVRLVLTATPILILFSAFSLVLFPRAQEAVVAMVFLVLGYVVFIFSIYRGAKRMQKELSIVNKYLANLEEIDKIDYKAKFFAQEFEDINENLIKALKKAKKREDIKQRYNAKLKLKNKQRADMLSAIAHEFRNPIASIMGYAQTLHEDPEIPKPLQEKFLEKIYNNGNKIESLLSRLILWNKFESGDMTLHKSTFDMQVLTHEIKAALQEKYKNREIIIEGDAFKVDADRALIELVLKNLVENALKYSNDEVFVRLSGRTVAVSDKGVGIREKDIDKVTKKFYRSGRHNWDNSMGLGLSIVKTILSLHKSRLEIESKLEEGSTFSFTL